MNEKQKELLLGMIQAMEGTTGYYGGVDKEDVDAYIIDVKAEFGFDYLAEKERIRLENIKRWENEPSDLDKTIHRAKENY